MCVQLKNQRGQGTSEQLPLLDFELWSQMLHGRVKAPNWPRKGSAAPLPYSSPWQPREHMRLGAQASTGCVAQQM